MTKKQRGLLSLALLLFVSISLPLLSPNNITASTKATLTLPSKNITVYTGTSYILALKSKAKVKWKSSNKKVATIKRGKVLTCKKAGKTRLSTVKNGKTYSYKINVIDPYLSDTELNIDDGEQRSLILYGAEVLRHISSNRRIITISQDGFITPKGNGSAYITIVDKNKHQYNCKVTVSGMEEEVEVENTSTVNKKTETTTKTTTVSSTESTSQSKSSKYQYAEDEPHEHNWVTTIYQYATCFRKSYYRQDCTLCGLIEYKRDPTLDHNYVEEFFHHQKANCTDYGYDEYVMRCTECYRCDPNSEHRMEIDYSEPPIGHDYYEVIDIVPTETTSGYEHSECANCHHRKDFFKIYYSPSPEVVTERINAVKEAHPNLREMYDTVFLHEDELPNKWTHEMTNKYYHNEVRNKYYFHTQAFSRYVVDQAFGQMVVPRGIRGHDYIDDILPGDIITFENGSVVFISKDDTYLYGAGYWGGWDWKMSIEEFMTIDYLSHFETRYFRYDIFRKYKDSGRYIDLIIE